MLLRDEEKCRLCGTFSDQQINNLIFVFFFEFVKLKCEDGNITCSPNADHTWLQNAKKAPNVSLGETVRARLKQFSVMNKLKKRALRVIFSTIFESLLGNRYEMFIHATILIHESLILLTVIISWEQVIAEHLSVEEAAGIKEGFQVMDTCNRGKINIDELRVGLHKLGHQVPDEDLLILMEAVSIITTFCLEKFAPQLMVENKYLCQISRSFVFPAYCLCNISN